MIKKRILAVSGSTRKNSSNEKILRAIAVLYGDALDVQIYNQIDKLPHFNPDITDEEVMPSVLSFRKLIEEADGVLICTPEYVFSLPGTLKNALEWTVSTIVFSHKPVAFIVAAAGGTKAFESLDLILSTLIQTKIPDRSKLLIQGGRSKVNEKDEIIDEKTLMEIRGVVGSLMRTMEQVNFTEGKS